MELRLVNGDYAVGEYHDFESVSGAGETAQRAMMKLAARRGGCAVLPEYGSRLYTLASVKEIERDGCVRQFVAEALDGEGLALRDAAIRSEAGRLYADLVIAGNGVDLTVTAEAGGVI